jgi:hypothetical protein
MSAALTDLWARICAMPRPHKVIDFPRKDPTTGEPIGQIAMWVLTQEEQEACAANANNKTRELIKSTKGEIPKDDDARDGQRDLYHNLAADEVLYRACRKVDDLKSSFFPSAALLRQYLSVDEVGVLISNYYSVQAELGPIVARMSAEEQEAFLARLQKSGDRFPLDSVSREELIRLLIFSVSRVPSSSTDTSSPGSPRDEPPKGESPVEDGDAFDGSGGAPTTE